MLKIPSLFARNERTRIVVDQYAQGVMPPSEHWLATEKINGATVRVTLRGGELVRLEARQLPSKAQIKRGIVTPWFREVDATASNYWLWEAARSTSFFGVPDGEWCGEAIGEKIQGNPYKLDRHEIILFSLIPWGDRLSGATVKVPQTFDRAPTDFEDLQDWLPLQRSAVNPDAQIEGLVWWHFETPVAKVKLRDFTG